MMQLLLFQVNWPAILDLESVGLDRVPIQSWFGPTKRGLSALTWYNSV